MKKNELFLVPLFLVFLGFLACNQDESTESVTESINYFDPCEVGAFHNYALANLISGVPEREYANTPEEGVDFLREIYRQSFSSYSSQLIFDDLEPEEITNEVLLGVLHKDFHIVDSATIMPYVIALFNNGYILESEINLIANSFNHAGDIVQLQNLLVTWDSFNFDLSSGIGIISKAAICLSLASSEYWENNHFQDNEIMQRVTPAHVDVGGLIIGMGMFALTTDDLSYQDIPRMMAAGVMTGVIASSGIAGRIGRFIFRG
jgi:hypothetical protein